MRYNTIHTKDLGKIITPVIKTLADEFVKPASHPLTNIVSYEKNIEIQMAIPGMTKDDITISLDKNTLTVSGNKSTSEIKYTQQEFNYASFKKTFNLPEVVNKETIAANVTNGILTISLEKIAEAQPKNITVL